MSKPGPKQSVRETTKNLIADPKDRIRLDDFVSSELRTAMKALDRQNFPASEVVSAGEFIVRLKKYESAVDELLDIVILLARWGEGEQLRVLEKIFERLIEVDRGSSGSTLWLRLGWYPIHLLMYGAGIAALSAKRVEVLSTIFLVRTPNEFGSGLPDRQLILAASALTEIAESFKQVPGHERHRVPRSEYLFEVLRPRVEELLMLGRGYEVSFDEFEVLWALIYADLNMEERGGAWGPVGRFGYKYSRGRGTSPLESLAVEVKGKGAKWRGFDAGLFGGSAKRFEDVTESFRNDFLNKLHWH